MKILYSAFECNPVRGSDAYVGWSWARQASLDHQVHVLTGAHNQADIRQHCANNACNAVFHYVSLPAWLQKCLKGRKGYFLSYLLWQSYAYRYARRLHKQEQFDVVHHVSIADFRVIGYLWKLNTPFVFGPVGGGQETPPALADYIRRYRKKERVRSILNRLALMRPSYRKGIRRAAAVLVSNDETMAVLKKHFGANIPMQQLCELGVDGAYLQERETLKHEAGETVHLIVSGRLMYRKGMELLLDACLHLQTKIPWVIDVYGGGHQEQDVRHQIQQRGLEEKVLLHGKVPYTQMQQAYASADIFLLPSLRETTGTAVIEAMANKLPVIALNQNGVKYLVSDRAGVLAQIGTKEETIKNFAAAMELLIEEPSKRCQLGEEGYRLLQTAYTWQVKLRQMEQLYRSIQQK